MYQHQTKPEHRNIRITKASGDEEDFAVEKLERSLLNAGAHRDTIAKIIEDIEGWIQPGVHTKKIYARAFSMLRRERTNSAMRYKLKRAIMELGPTGYPFEAFIGEIFERQGYKTEVGMVVDGSCVTHEMDVIATNHEVQHLVECKYGKDQGKHVSVQVPLYVRSRVNDIISKRQNMKEYEGLKFIGWVVTNTRFTSDSMQYAKCSGLELLAWDYPENKSLKSLIESLKVYPITVLSQLTNKEKQWLLEKKVVSCTQLFSHPNVLKELAITERKKKMVMKELEDICG